MISAIEDKNLKGSGVLVFKIVFAGVLVERKYILSFGVSALPDATSSTRYLTRHKIERPGLFVCNIFSIGQSAEIDKSTN